MKKKRGISSSPKYNFGGGLVTMAAKTRLRPSQLIRAKNINILIDGEVEARGGYTKVSSVPFGETIDRFIHFKTPSYDKIFAYGGKYLKYLKVGTPDTWETLDESLPATGDFRSMEIANDMLYIGSASGVKRYRPGQSLLWNAGIAVPGSTLRATEDTAGNLNGTYRWCYTQYNSVTGEEGNPSPFTADLTVSGKRVVLDVFPASHEAGCDKWRIYRNPSGVTSYFYVGVCDIGAASFTDNVADDSLGAELDERNGVPPKAAILLWHLNRMFYVDSDNPSTLWWSEPYKPGSVHSTSFQGIEKGDGGRIVALASCFDNLIVFKDRGVYLFVFNALSPLSSYYQPIATRYGCIAPMSVANIREDVVFLSPEGLKRITNGGTSIVDITTLIEGEFGAKPIDPVANILRDCFPDVVKHAVGMFYEARNQYHLSVPYYSNTNNDLTLVWNCESETFTTHEGFNVRAVAPYRYYDRELLYRSHNDQYIYKHDYGYTDDGVDISFDVQTGWHDVNGIPDSKTIRLFYPTIFGGGDLVISYEILRDFESLGSGVGRAVQHIGASYWGYSHWGYSHWGASGEIVYRHRTKVKGRIFSVRFFGSVNKRCGIAGYQFFFLPRSL